MLEGITVIEGKVFWQMSSTGTNVVYYILLVYTMVDDLYQQFVPTSVSKRRNANTAKLPWPDHPRRQGLYRESSLGGHEETRGLPNVIKTFQL